MENRLLSLFHSVVVAQSGKLQTSVPKKGFTTTKLDQTVSSSELLA
ncbi:unnamed protein product, partial [Rotaria sp. Silwood1]